MPSASRRMPHSGGSSAVAARGLYERACGTAEMSVLYSYPFTSETQEVD